MAETIKVGLLGCGIVGGATARILRDHAGGLRERAGALIEVARVAVRSPSKPRAVELDPRMVTTDPWEVVHDPSINIVVEAIGGIEPARDLIIEALKSGKHVVTANKELRASLSAELMETAAGAG